MNTQEFIDAVKIRVVSGSLDSIHSILIKPPGREPAQKYVEMSKWYNQLSDGNKSMVLKVAKESIESAVFGFLCVLDGVSAIENTELKGKLLLYFEKNGERTLLNNSEEDFLHDLFNVV